MKSRLLRSRWIAAVPLCIALCGAWITCGYGRPQMKQYVVWACPDLGLSGRTGVRFAYPADFHIQEFGKDGICIVHNPPRGFSAWISQRLNVDQFSAWKKASIVIQFRSGQGRLLINVGDVADWMQPESGTSSIVRERIGPGIIGDNKGSGGETFHVMWLFPGAATKNCTIESAGSQVIIMYESSAPIEPRIHYVVNDLVSSMQIVQL